MSLASAIALFAAFGAVLVAGARLAGLGQRGFYRRVAHELGLTAHQVRFFSLEGAVMSGSLNDFRVTAASGSRDKQPTLRVTIDSAGRAAGTIPTLLELRPQAAVFSLFGSEDVITGDVAFDAAVRVGGGAFVALAVLSAEVRGEFLSVLCRVLLLEVRNGCVILEVLADDPAISVSDIHAALGLARKLALPPDGIEELVVHQAVHDPLPAVRLRAFAALAPAAGDPGVGQEHRVARMLLEDRHPELRLRAAMRLAGEGFEHLALVVGTPAPAQRDGGDGRLWWEISLPGSGPAPDDTLLETPSAHERRRARALLHLVDHHAAARVLPLVRTALEAQGPLLLAALGALAKIADSSFEAAAVSALHSRLPEVRRAAAEALGAIGTVAAIPALRAFVKDSDHAVLRIQARLTGAAAGQVALADPGQAAGRLALAPDETGGRLALAPEGGPESTSREREAGLLFVSDSEDFRGAAGGKGVV